MIKHQMNILSYRSLERAQRFLMISNTAVVATITKGIMSEGNSGMTSVHVIVSLGFSVMEPSLEVNNIGLVSYSVSYIITNATTSELLEIAFTIIFVTFHSYHVSL